MPPQPRISGVLNKLRGLSAALVVAVAFHSNAAVLYVTQLGLPPNTNSLAGINASFVTNSHAGDVIHLIGTFTNGISATDFVGNYGNPCTFLFDSGAKFSAPAWGQSYQPSGAINPLNSYSNGSIVFFSAVRSLVIDGGVNGLMEATANGAQLQWSNRCDGITLGCLADSSFEIKNLTISNLFVRNNGQIEGYTTGHGGEFNYIVSGQGIVAGGGFTNSSIHNCILTGTANMIAMTYNLNTRDVFIYSNTITHCSFAIQIYGTGDASGGNWQLYGNHINTGDDWGGNNSFSHGDGIICNQHQVNSLAYDPSGFTNRYSGVYYVTNSSTNILTLGGYVVTLPAWGQYGNYFNYSPFTNYPTRDTNNFGILTHYDSLREGVTNQINIWTTMTPMDATQLPGGAELDIVTFFSSTNTVVLLGTSNALVTATLGWLHSATNTGMQIYGNYLGPVWGTNASGSIGVYSDMPSGFQKYKIYNNVIVINAGTLMGNSIAVGDQCLMANNSFIQLETSPTGVGFVCGFGGGTNVNNLVYGFNKATSFNVVATDSRGYGWYDMLSNNVYYGISEWMAGQGTWPTLFYNPAGAPGFYRKNVAIYRQQDGYETLSQTNYPLLSATYAPLTNDVVLITNGVNLTYLGITNDFYGSPRPSSGAWTVGAFQDAGQPAVFAPAAFRFWGRFP
jgi:hypothetical protein